MNIMKNGALFLLIILILGLILAPFLGGSYREGYENKQTSWADKVTLASGVTKDPNSTTSTTTTTTTGKPSGGSYDNYDHFSGTSSPTVYYGPNGSTATVTPSSSGSYTITVTNTNGQTKQYTLSAASSSSTGTTSATGATGATSANNSSFSSSLSSMMSQFANKTFYGPNGGSARLFTGKDGQYAIEETLANGNTTIYTATNTYTYTYANQQSGSSSNGSSSGTSSDTGSSSSSIFPFSDYSTSNSNSNSSANANGQYNSSLPAGIPARMIPRGQEDLYILKSEVVPPVCPMCPSASVCPSKDAEKCPPCPACARCPESNFECKKVPNYNAVNDSYLPVPVLSNFSTFGM